MYLFFSEKVNGLHNHKFFFVLKVNRWYLVAPLPAAEGWVVDLDVRLTDEAAGWGGKTVGNEGSGIAAFAILVQKETFCSFSKGLGN